ncbi:MAG: thermonuclease family protein [Desulfovibrionaceae bacterium]|nr:thermonuclease family protein [Desulfovibrionaceae bacterium]
MIQPRIEEALDSVFHALRADDRFEEYSDKEIKAWILKRTGFNIRIDGVNYYIGVQEKPSLSGLWSGIKNKLIWIILLPLMVFAMTLAYTRDSKAHSLKRGDIIVAKCINVYDGDSLTVIFKGEKIKIRLVGIDAPELQQEFGYDARQILAIWALDKEVRITVSGIDKYGRVLAVVQGLGVGERWVDVAVMLTASGLAWYEEKYCLTSISENCEEYRKNVIYAKEHKEGIFGGLHIEHPSTYRQRMKNKKK